MKTLTYLYSKFDHCYTILTNGCWSWAKKGNYIYPRIQLETGWGSAYELAHRFSYMIHKGDPKNFVVHHTCNDKMCVNPDHLKLKTNAEHISLHNIRSYCKQGHKITFYSGKRRCKICDHISYYKRRSNKTPEIRTQ